MLDGCVPWPDEYVKQYQKEGIWEGVTLGEAFDSCVEKHADLPAVAYKGHDISYLQMDEYATRLAYRMTKLGMRTYDTLILQLFNAPELIYLLYACFKIGVIPICTLPTHRWPEISYIAQQCKARAHAIPGGIIKGFDYEQFADEVRNTAPNIKTVFTAGKTERREIYSINELIEIDIDLEEAKAELKKYRPDPMEPALFQLSGGTTGMPKLIPRTHNDYLYNARCVGSALEIDNSTRWLITTPLVHNVALVCGLLPTHINGGTIVINPSFAPEAILQAISDNKANCIWAVPVTIHRIMDLSDAVIAKYDLKYLNKFMGGWKPGDAMIEGFMKRFHCPGVQTYGMAEGLICWSRWTDNAKFRHNTQGHPVSKADECKVVDPETFKDVPVGEVGEMWCRGPYTIRGYYKSPDRNKEAFTKDGYYRTGDLVKIDKHGNVTWVGRIKDCIDRGSEKINAEEIENYILKFRKVHNVSVVGMPDKVMGERICAFIVPKAGNKLNLEELNEFLTKEMQVARFKLPERLELINELPVTKIGKWDKKILREMITKLLKKEDDLRLSNMKLL